MTEQPQQPGVPSSRPPDVWGAGPDRRPAGAPAAGSVPGRQVDPALDPDRYDPDAPPAPEPVGGSVPLARLDMSRDPDRYRPDDRTLTEMLGEGAQEESRDTYVWLAGLLAVLAFLGLVALVVRNLGP